MARRPPKAEQDFGSDSFLDIVANVVGILIVLVMVVGMRVEHAPPAEEAKPKVDLSASLAAVRSLEDQTLQLASQAEALARETLAQGQRQNRLAANVVQRKQSLEAGRQALDAQAQEELAARRQLWAAQSLVQQLERDLSQVSTTKKTTKIETYPTPISRVVEGEEAHFQLRGGRIAYIPLEELLDQLKSDAHSQFWKLKDLPEATATVGPVGGFRLRYTFERVDVPLEDQLAGKRFISSYAQLSQWTLIPSDNLLGETFEEAVDPRSAFRLALARLKPGRTTITLWTYPDSFGVYRQVKKELYQLGFPTAGRPLPDDKPIGGSPNGSKSAAQ